MTTSLDAGASVARAAAKGRIAQMVLWGLVLAALGVLVLYPMYWLGIGGFQTESGEWTLKYYRRVVSPYYLNLFWVTLKYTFFVTVFALAVGIPMAWAVARTDLPGKGFFRAATAMTFVLPPLFQAIAFIVIFQPNAGVANLAIESLFGVKPFDIFSFPGLVFVTVLGVYPQSFLLLDSALHSMDPSLEEAASMAGARPWRIVTRVTLPLVLPTILTSTIFSAILTMAVFGPPAVIGIPAKIYVITSQIYAELSSYPPQIEFAAAIGVFFLAITMILITIQYILLRKGRYTTISGKGLRPRQMSLGRWKWPVFAACMMVVFIALILPAAVLVVMSITKVAASGLVPGNLTFAHYWQVLFVQDRTLTSIQNTLVLAVTTVFTTIGAGIVVAYIVVKTQHRLRTALRYLTFLPYSVPGVVFTVGVILAFIRPPLVLYGTMTILIVCYFARFLPFTVQPLTDGLRQIDDSLVDAASVTGSTWMMMVQRILAPLLKFTIMSTALLVFVSCLREFVSAILLFTPGKETLLVLAFQFWEEGYPQMTASLMVVLLVLVIGFYLTARRITGDRVF